MSREKDLIKNTAVLSISKLVAQLISFCVLPLYTVLLTTEDYGTVDLINTIVFFCIPIVGLQIDSGVFRHLIPIRDDEEKIKQLISTAFFTNLIQSIVYMLIFISIRSLFNIELKDYLATNVVLAIFSSTCLQILRGIGHNSMYALADAIQVVSAVTLNVVFVAVLKMGPQGLLLGTLISHIIVVIVVIILMRISKYISFKYVSASVFKSVISYSIPLIPNSISWWVIGISDRLVVSGLISVAANGIYAIANKFSLLYIAVFNVFNLNWIESATLHINDDDRDGYLSEIIDTMITFFTYLCYGIIGVIPFVFFMFDQSYSEAYNHIPILMLASLFQVIVGLYSVVFVAKKKTKVIAVTSMEAAVVNVTINLLLVNQIGIYSASISTLIAYMFLFVSRLIYIDKEVNISINKRSILIEIVLGAILLFTYYRRDHFLSGCALIVLIVLAIWANYGKLKKIFMLKRDVKHE
ncbi:MAG: polysaccharide biosynthesis C-terminal domain-containing protein [Saccharofermentans sp.]|nr:polysaccharide biosynthesis C-terminal domain-containing protein [Saccharofermentans sp.]